MLYIERKNPYIKIQYIGTGRKVIQYDRPRVKRASSVEVGIIICLDTYPTIYVYKRRRPKCISVARRKALCLSCVYTKGKKLQNPV